MKCNYFGLVINIGVGFTTDDPGLESQGLL